MKPLPGSHGYEYGPCNLTYLFLVRSSYPQKKPTKRNKSSKRK